MRGVSESVLEALARALQLEEAERGHLFDLARAAGTTTKARRRPTKQRVRPAVQHMLDAITGAPALARNGRLDILATNALARALYSEMYVDPVRPANHVRLGEIRAPLTPCLGSSDTVGEAVAVTATSSNGRSPCQLTRVDTSRCPTRTP